VRFSKIEKFKYFQKYNKIPYITTNVRRENMVKENNEIKTMVGKLKDMEPGQRLSFLCGGIDNIVEKMRKELTEEAIKEAKKMYSDTNPIKCSCGNEMYFQGNSKKKRFYQNSK
jgi:hypothetical protein